MKLKYVGLGLLVIFPAAVLVVIGILRGQGQEPRSSAPSASMTTVQTSSASPTMIEHDGVTISSEYVTALHDSVFRFEQAFRSPQSDQRTKLLKSLCTPEGLAMVGPTEGGNSIADQASKDVTVSIDRIGSSLQVEPFDATAVSVFAKIKLVVAHGDEKLPATTVTSQTSWVFDAVTRTWKMAAITY